MKTTTNADRAKSALLAIPLLASASVFGVEVVRSSLLGYTVGGEVLEVDGAAEKLAKLVWRVKGALARAAANLKARKLSGTFTVRATETLDGRPCVYVLVRVVNSEVDFVKQDTARALGVVVDACRAAYLYASVDNGCVFVTGG